MKRIIACLIVLSLLLAGCGQIPNADNRLADDSKATEEGVKAVVEANNQFAFELYSKLRENGGNVFFSPYSISVALAMTYEGARGQTAEEMQSVLHLPEDYVRKPAFARIYNQINQKDSSYKLSTANALWAQENYRFLEEYLDTVEKYYGGKATNLNFAESEKSRKIINIWVEEQTNNKIVDLIPPGVLSALTRMVLTNAVYFKGTWIKQFDKKETQNQDFLTEDGKAVQVPMMRLTGEDAKFNYAETENIQILELGYDGDELSMILILPKEGLEELETINKDKFAEWKSTMHEQRVDIYIPKFKFETKNLMATTLSDMGMPTAFTPDADFSGIDGTRELMIQNVIHQAFVEVNEEGTEAAAATAVIVGITSVGPTIPIFLADHPFIFIIQQKETGNILFMGRVMNPSD